MGEYELPEGWTVVAAGNRETDRAVTHRMPSALANRFVHLDFSVDPESWQEWAEGQGLSEEVRAFIRFRPNLLHDFDPRKDEKAFPSPRSWDFAARILESDPDPDVLLSLLKGTVGPGAATEFAGFSRMFRQLPDPDAVINQPDSAVIPEEPATLYALCEALGVTKSAASQMVGKLKQKGFIKKEKASNNDKEILAYLTDTGWEAFADHKEFHERHLKTLTKRLDDFPDNQLAIAAAVLATVETTVDDRIEELFG